MKTIGVGRHGVRRARVARAAGVGAILAALAVARPGSAQTTYYDVFQGFRANVEGQPNNAPTEWMGFPTNQPHNEGWTYLSETSSALFGWWTFSHGTAFTVDPAVYTEMDYVWSLGRPDIALAWGKNGASSQSGSPALISNASTNTDRVLGWGTPWGIAVGLYVPGNSYDDWPAIKWTAAEKGSVTVSNHVWGVPNEIAEVHLGIYRQGTATYQYLDHAVVSATDYSGSGHPEVITDDLLLATDVAVEAGDAVWIVARSYGWNGNNAKLSASVQGSIAFTPEPPPGGTVVRLE